MTVMNEYDKLVIAFLVVTSSTFVVRVHTNNDTNVSMEQVANKG